MKSYESILVAVDIYSDYEPVIARALNIAGTDVKMNLIYVVYPQTSIEPYGLFLETDYSDEICEQAKTRLRDIATKHGIEPTNTHVVVGAAADEIHDAAERLKADLIVIGTHGRSGVRLLLGSTANAVMHGVKVDVLAVKV